jgi:hypothetical protein
LRKRRRPTGCWCNLGRGVSARLGKWFPRPPESTIKNPSAVAAKVLLLDLHVVVSQTGALDVQIFYKSHLPHLDYDLDV